MARSLRLVCGALAVACGSPAAAELPAAARVMIEAAQRSGNEGDVATVTRYLMIAHPDAAAEIAALDAAWRSARFVPPAVALDTRAPPAIQPDVRWSGRGQLGASRATGNSSTTGFNAALRLTAEAEEWRVKLAVEGDYERSNGKTTRARTVAAIEPQYRLTDRTLIYGLGQHERDDFQDYRTRTSLSGGVGYRLLMEEPRTLEVKAGPALRYSQLAAGGTITDIAGLVSLDLDLALAPGLKLSQDASAYVGNRNDSFVSLTALDSRILGRLSGRLSYSVRHETQPTGGRERTDTLSRVSLVYDF
jgi:putative salt-induced outer membrane protein